MAGASDRRRARRGTADTAGMGARGGAARETVAGERPDLAGC